MTPETLTLLSCTHALRSFIIYHMPLTPQISQTVCSIHCSPRLPCLGMFFIMRTNALQLQVFQSTLT